MDWLIALTSGAVLASAAVPPADRFDAFDTLSRQEVAAAADGDQLVIAEIDALRPCLAAGSSDEADCSAPCGDDLSPAACAHAASRAWTAYLDHYLALLRHDPTVRAAVDASQARWRQSADADCALSSSITEIRKLPFRGFHSEQCMAGTVIERALTLRAYAIDLYGSADIQGGEPYPRPLPPALQTPAR